MIAQPVLETARARVIGFPIWIAQEVQEIAPARATARAASVEVIVEGAVEVETVLAAEMFREVQIPVAARAPLGVVDRLVAAANAPVVHEALRAWVAVVEVAGAEASAVG